MYIRYKIIISFVLAVVTLVLLRAGRTMIVEGEKWRSKADQIQYDTVAVLADRGDILAADGRLLATTMPLYTMYIDMGVVERNIDTFNYHLDALCRELAQIPGGRTADEYRRHLQAGFTARSKRHYRLSTKKLTYVEKEKILSYPFFNKKNSNKTGLIMEPMITRERPFGMQAKATIGGLHAGLTEGLLQGGSSGIELQYDSLLRGLPGRKEIQNIPGQPIEKIFEAPIAGKDIVTTLDVDIQDMAESALMDKLIEINADYGVAVIMEVETGAIRAIANLDRNTQGIYVEGVMPNFLPINTAPKLMAKVTRAITHTVNNVSHTL